MHKYGQEINYRIERLSPDNSRLLGDFSCGNEAIDDYLHEQALEDTKNVCYICIDEDRNSVAGFAALSCSGIQYVVDQRRETLPAIQISYFAVANDIQRLVFDETDEHFYFSDMLFAEILQKCREITEEYIGAEYVILYSVPTAKHFYERNFFKDYSEFMQSDHYQYLNDCVPMYMQL